METYFQVESARLAASAGDHLLRQSLGEQISLGKNKALFSSRVSKALDVRCSSGKIPSASAKKAKRPCKASSSKSAMKLTEGPSSDCDNIDVESV